VQKIKYSETAISNGLRDAAPMKGSHHSDHSEKQHNTAENHVRVLNGLSRPANSPYHAMTPRSLMSHDAE